MWARMTTQTHSIVALLSWLLIVCERKIVAVLLRRRRCGALRLFFAAAESETCVTAAQTP
jgi:hypothetical protein